MNRNRLDKFNLFFLINKIGLWYFNISSIGTNLSRLLYNFQTFLIYLPSNRKLNVSNFLVLFVCISIEILSNGAKNTYKKLAYTLCFSNKSAMLVKIS